MAQPILARLVTPTRSVAGWPLLVGLSLLALVGALGNAWDLYWHIVIGRDTFWIPPHAMMYSAVALSGLAAAVVVVGDTARGAADGEVTTILGLRAPLGIFVLGAGALQMVVSAPFDDWWHRVYGVDVTVWSPPHLVGFSGAITMLSGLIIAVCAERQRSLHARPGQQRAVFWLVALLFALVVRWITFLNSTTLQLSWQLREAEYAVAGPWAPWWGLWASLFVGWTLVASARCWPGRQARLPLAVLGLVLVLRALEFVVSAVGFALVLPWGVQTLRRPFVPLFDWDLGLWVTTLVLVLPTTVLVALTTAGRAWTTLRFGVVAGFVWGGLLALQFLLLLPVFGLASLDLPMHGQVILVATLAGLVGGVIGAAQGDWLARFRR
ncbi:MAG: hypothetical protein M3R24_03890 [Chloroflexota bacterium]|nr:hypothetical protein [Chloroflexota bacterium]